MDGYNNQNFNGGQQPQYQQFIPQQPVYIPPVDPFYQARQGIKRAGLYVGLALSALLAMQFFAGVAQLVYSEVYLRGAGIASSSAAHYAFYLVTYFLMFLPALLIVGIPGRNNGLFRILSEPPKLSPTASQEEYLAYQNAKEKRSRLLRGFVPCVLAGTVMMMGSSYAMSVVAGFVERAFNLIGLVSPEYFDDEPQTALGWVLYLLVLCVAAPVTEEMFFRGAVLNMLKPYGVSFAIVCQALMFSIFHGTVAQLPYTLTGGLLLGYIAHKYGGILPTMLIHALNNGISVLMSHYFSGLDQTTDLLLGCAIYIVLIGGAVIIAAVMSKRDKDAFAIKGDAQSTANAMPRLTAVKTFLCSPAVIVYTAAQAAMMLLAMIENSLGLI